MMCMMRNMKRTKQQMNRAKCESHDDEGDGTEECRNDQLPDEEYEQQARLLLNGLIFGMIHP